MESLKEEKMVKKRQEVEDFSLVMEAVLSSYDEEKGSGGWKYDTPTALWNHLSEEVRELEKEIFWGDKEKILKEVIDVGNMAMMIYDVVSHRQEETHMEKRPPTEKEVVWERLYTELLSETKRRTHSYELMGDYDDYTETPYEHLESALKERLSDLRKLKKHVHSFHTPEDPQRASYCTICGLPGDI